ncbi:hypothetical protein JCM8097_002880 [Rhodosporidiobolus ruineniae]
MLLLPLLLATPVLAFTPPLVDPSTLADELARLSSRHAQQLEHYAANRQLHPEVFERAREAKVRAVELEGRTKGRLRKRQSQRGVVELYDFYSQPLDIMIYGPVSLGTPAREFPLLFDTGSADLWVYEDGTGSQHPEYDPTESRSSVTEPREEWSIRYGKGSQTGVLVQDVVSLGGYTVNDTVFAAADSLNSAFTAYPISGIFGLGFGTIASSGYAPWFERLLRSGQLAEQYFGVYFTRGRDTEEAEGRVQGSVRGAQMCVGCVDSTKYEGEITWNEVTSDGFWAIESDGVVVNGTLVEGTAMRACIDTGTTLIQLPTSVAAALYASIPGAYPAPSSSSSLSPSSSSSSATGQTYIIPCSTRFSSFGFSFAGRVFEVGPEDLLRAVSRDGRLCVLSVAGGGSRDVDGTEVAIIGGAFLKSTYSIFSYSHLSRPAIGFARSVIATSWNDSSSAEAVLDEDRLGGLLGGGGGGGLGGGTGTVSEAPGPAQTQTASRTATGRGGGLGSTATALTSSAFGAPSSVPSSAASSSSEVDASTTAHVLAGLIAALAVGGGWMLG